MLNASMPTVASHFGLPMITPQLNYTLPPHRGTFLREPTNEKKLMTRRHVYHSRETVVTWVDKYVYKYILKYVFIIVG